MQAMKKIKYSHYEVLAILKYFSESIEGFDDLQLRQASAHEAMLYAAQNGIIEFINAMRGVNPGLMSTLDNSDGGILWYAIKNRRQKVFQLIYFLNGLEKDMFRYRTDAFGNNLLHVAALLDSSSKRNRSAPAMQIQRETQWFEVTHLISFHYFFFPRFQHRPCIYYALLLPTELNLHEF